MDTKTFLANAVMLERETEAAYLKLIAPMVARGNHDAAEFFHEMAGFCRMHLDVAAKRAGFDGSTDIGGITGSLTGTGDTEIPQIKNPELALDLDDAMSLALEAEKRGVAFYEGIARSTSNNQTRRYAEEFAAEERGHVLALERFFGLEPY